MGPAATSWAPPIALHDCDGQIRNDTIERIFVDTLHTHDILQDYFGTPQPDFQELVVTEPPKIRIKHKSDPFVKISQGPPAGASESKNKIKVNLKKKLLKRPVTRLTKVKSSLPFLTNPRPGARPHKIRITATSSSPAPPPVTSAPPPGTSASPAARQTTAASSLRAVTVQDTRSHTVQPSTGEVIKFS